MIRKIETKVAAGFFVFLLLFVITSTVSIISTNTTVKEIISIIVLLAGISLSFVIVNSLKNAVRALSSESKRLTDAAKEGRLDVRGNVDIIDSGFQGVIRGLNETLDAVTGPFGLAARCIDQIAKGDIPSKITSIYRGDFNEVIDNINKLIDVTVENKQREEEILLIKSAIETSGTPVVISDKKGIKAVSVNKAFQNLFGYSMDELNAAGGPATLFVDKTIGKEINKTNLSGKTWIGELELRARDNRIITSLTSLDAIRNEKGEPVGGILVFNDITEQKMVLNAVQELTEKIKGGDLSTRAEVTASGNYQKLVDGVNQMLDAVVDPLNMAAEYIDRISKGDTPPKITNTYYGDFNKIKDNLNTCIDTFGILIDEIGIIINAGQEGRLDQRANPDRTTGVWRKILRGINDAVDTIIRPLNVAAEYIDRISKGDIPPKITETYHGDFNEIKNNLNNCIEAVNGLLEEANSLIAAIGEGKLDARGNEAAFAGNWGRLLGNMNRLIEAIAKPINELMAVLNRMAVNDYTRKIEGDYTGAWHDLKNATNMVHEQLAKILEIAGNVSNGNLTDLDELRKTGRKSENDQLIPAFIRMIEAVKNLVVDTNMLATAAVEGRLNIRADAAKHGGEYRNVVEGVNATLNAIIGPLNVATEYIDRIARGDIPPKITGNYNGDFNEIKNNLNTCIDTINGLLKEADNLIDAAREGKLDIRGNTAAYAGGWAKLVEGMNGLMKAIAEPVGDLIFVLGQYALNDYSNKMEKEYVGIWNDLKNATNEVHERFNNIHRTVIKISNGDLSDKELYVNIGRRCEKDDLVPGFIRMHEAIQKLTDDVNMLAAAALEGKLSTRADAAGHQGEFRKVVEGINNMMDTVIKPINEATACLKEMADGNLDTKMTGDFQGDYALIKDALNATLETLNKVIKIEAVKCLQEIAKGNLDVAVIGEYQGDYAVIKNALNTTINDLNEILGQIMIAIDQVSNGAQQVSDSSQSLSQGAAESASTMEEITSSMHEMNAQTKRNAENAIQANQLATQARNNAEKGNEQMAQMVKAMGDINESASNISKIIKAIDEIAFQTNLLALNAAVEAARAGKHGKGFTVVAEEVRNLAQRSAKAAKETAEMIEDSIKKTEVGTRIAEDTSNALKEIVLDVTKVTDFISEIASASKEQAQGIEQINEGLGQVDQVTQQNSASSEELAAASQEMSGQSEMVKQMLGRFKLKRQAMGNFSMAPETASQVWQKRMAGSEYQQVPRQFKRRIPKAGRISAAEVAATSFGEKSSPESITSLDDQDYYKF